MKKHVIFLIALLCLGAISCKTEPNSEPIAKAVVREWKPDDTRSIFGNQEPRGLLLSTEMATPGYVMFNPSNSTETYLMDRQGQIVHSWKGELNTELSSYLLENGHLVRLERDTDFPRFAAGGIGGRIREYDWDGNMLWDFKYADDKVLMHHDIEVLPNGNVLAISYESKSAEEALAAGIDPERIPKAGVWPDKIIEIKPTLPAGGEIVWEWHLWDHLVQDRYPDKANYGKIEEHPGRMNINSFGEMELPPLTESDIDQLKKVGFLTSNATYDNQGSDISHCNAVSYNADLDQVAISLKRFGEIIIIDHSTSTEEARGSQGGRFGHGGDLLYRWGNPANYGRGSEKDRVLFEQHDVKFIPKNSPGAGHLLVFNNDIPGENNRMSSIFAALMAARSPDPQVSIADIGNYSAVLELELPADPSGSYILPENAPFGPSEPLWSFTAADTYSFYSPIESGAQRMPNGNTLVTMGVKGELFEVTPEKELVWQYRNPYNFNYKLPDGSPPQPGALPYRQFRSTFFPADFKAFEGKELKPVVPQPEPFIFRMPPPPTASGATQQ